MKPRPKPQDSATQELFWAKLRNIINLQHELVRLEKHFAAYCREAGRPGPPILLVMGLRRPQPWPLKFKNSKRFLKGGLGKSATEANRIAKRRGREPLPVSAEQAA